MAMLIKCGYLVDIFYFWFWPFDKLRVKLNLSKLEIDLL